MGLLSKLLGNTVGAIIPPAAEYFTKREERKTQIAQLNHERELEKIRGKIAYEKAKSERAEKSEGRDADWELESIRNSGWKDELVIIVLSIPLIAVFIPQLAPYILEGFRILETTPDWYRWLIVMIYAATFGIRVWRRKV